MTASTRRVRYIGRNHDTPAYRATPIREAILPIADEYTGRQRRLTWAVMIVVGVLFWTAIVCAVFS